MTAREILICLANKHNNNWDKIYQDIKNKITPTSEEIAKYNISDHKVITLVDEDYPQTLKNTYRPPFVLFYSGNKDSLTKSNLIYLVGENKFGLDDKTTIVASLSRVAISDDLVLYNCEDTEKIASALCEKLVITEEHETKKALISVHFALEDNKDIYVAPTREKSFANDLIKQGANLIDSIEDLA